jgi:Reverse transcriptase (RNA-dependent DNA polymerase)
MCGDLQEIHRFQLSICPEPIYHEFPTGYSSPSGSDTVYKDLKSIYSNVCTAKLWYKHLRPILLDKLHFTISKKDSYLFYRANLIFFVFYVVDGFIVAEDPLLITSLITKLRSLGLDLNIKADYPGYLGVDIRHNPEGTLLLSQTGLIDSIIIN